jgi:hypothetical protein
VTTTMHDIDRIGILLPELEDLDVASKVIDGQIQIETRIAGNKLYETVKPEVDRLGKLFAKAFLDLHSAHSAYSRYVDEIEDAGGNVSTLRVRPNFLNHPTDSNYFYGLESFIEAGFASKSDMPKALVQ